MRSSKRAVLVLVASSLLCSLATSPAAALPPQTFGRVSQAAFSSWTQWDKDELWLYFAVGERTVYADSGYAPTRLPDIDVSEVPGMGAVGRGKCQVFKHGSMCMAVAIGHDLDFTSLTFDPLLDSAEMDISDHGHHVYWTGLGQQSQPQFWGSGDLAQLRSGAQIARRAAIEGQIFNKEMERRKPTFSHMYQGTDIDVFFNLFKFRDDGTVTLKLWIPR